MTISDDALDLANFDRHNAVVGKTGSGKSYALRGVVERWLEAGRRACILDPTGVWWGLRSTADGSGAGFPVVVFGGERGDVAITGASADRLAEVVAGRNLPCVIDLSEFTMGAKHRFVTDFIAGLHKRNRAPLHLVIDEADEFAPQNPLPESRRMLHEVDRLVRRGRIRGFRVTLITQRPAVLHKNVLTQADTLIAMRLPGPQDRKAVEEWIKGQADADQGKAVIASLASLQRGEGWVWAPDRGVLARTTFPAIRTFDSGRTPEDGEEIAEPEALAPVNLSELVELLSEPEEEEPARPARPSPETLARARQEGYNEGVAAERARVGALLNSIQGALSELAESAKRQAAMAGDAADAIRLHLASAAPEKTNGRAPIVEAPRPSPAARQRTEPTAGMGKAERLILTALAQHPRGRTKTQVAILTGYAVNGGAFNNALSALRRKGWVEWGYPLRITPAGLDALGPFDPLPHGRALLEYWLGQLGRAERLTLEAVAAAYPSALTKEEAAQRAGYEPKGGGFNNALSRLRSLELISGRGELRASDALFG